MAVGVNSISLLVLVLTVTIVGKIEGQIVGNGAEKKHKDTHIGDTDISFQNLDNDQQQHGNEFKILEQNNGTLGNNTKEGILESVNDTVVSEAEAGNVNSSERVNDSYVLPAHWREFCTVDNSEYMESKFTERTRLTTIRCNVTAKYSSIWSTTDLRESLKDYENSSLAFNVDLQCFDNSIVNISHPMQVYKLYKISIQGCTIMDYLVEHNNTSLLEVPDSLRVLNLQNNTLMIRISEFISMTRNIKNLRKEFDCIHENTIESIIDRNTRYDFLDDVDPTKLNLTELGEAFMYDSQRIKHTCNYVHLLKIDQGNSDSRSTYHMDLMTDNSFYDELLVYNYSYNRLKQLDDQHLRWSLKFPKLQVFDLSHNEISKIYRFQVPLHTSNRVTTINLQYNNITSITVQDLDRFKDIPMMFIDLRNNPIDCNCSESLKELLKFVADGSHLRISKLVNYSYIGQLKCASPKQLVGRTLSSLDAATICEPEVEYYLVPLICLSVAIVILCIVLFITIRYRQEITIVLFTRFNIIVPCYSRESFDSSKKYDAFVSYSSNEEEYIEKLFEDLEKPSDNRVQFKFCLHHRDFVPGKTIFQNVAESVESSRHTIILLSNHFLKSHYCLHEFQEAFRQSIMEQKRHLVIVMMEDIPEDKLPRDLRRCIKTFTYIRKDDYLFTERLIYALSIKQKSKIVQDNDKPKVNGKSNGSISKTTKSQISETSNASVTSNKPSKSSLSNDVISKNLINSNSQSKDKTATQISDTVVPQKENELNRGSVDKLENENENPENTKVLVKTNSQKLNVNIQPTIVNCCTSEVERKISNDYDRSVSTDTGYGSERGSYCEKLSPEVCVELGEFPSQLEVQC